MQLDNVLERFTAIARELISTELAEQTKGCYWELWPKHQPATEERPYDAYMVQLGLKDYFPGTTKPHVNMHMTFTTPCSDWPGPNGPIEVGSDDFLREVVREAFRNDLPYVKSDGEPLPAAA